MNLACTTRKGRKMKINSKQKGARFERQLAGIFRDYGYKNARRTAQYCGNTGDASDVVGLPGMHVEAKHQERMQLYDWMDQAKRDAKASSGEKLPVVFHKRNNHSILVTMELNDWMQIYREYQSGMVQQARERHLSPLIEQQTVDRCVYCGEIVPEGRQVCWNCEREVEESGEHKEHC